MRSTLALLAALYSAAAFAAAPPEYPDRPIRMVLPQGPGSTTDLLGRIAFIHTSERLGKQIVVDNRPGAGGTLGMGSAGVGSTSHLGGLLFATQAGITANHVPYKGAANVAGLAQNEVAFIVAPLSAAMPQVRAGRVRCLGTGGDKRSAVTPELPTIAESGVPGFRFYGWNGVIALRATPKPVILKFNRVMNDALRSPELRKQYFELGEEPAIGTPEDFAKLIREDYEKMGKLVKLAGVKTE